MNVQAADREELVASAIKEISHIATLPEITIKIIELVENPTSTAQDLHNVISNDPALCSRILKVVNSSFYGLPGQIGSINRAIVLLGLNAVKNIAISASLAKLFKGGQLCPAFNARSLWEHSIGTATAAKLISDELKLGISDEAFLAGLMHDIGIMVMMQARRDKLVEVFEKVPLGADGSPTGDMLEAEENILGVTHQDFGRGLCVKWKFPQSFALVCGSHHTPLEAPAGNRTLPCVIHVADRIAGEAQPNGYRHDLTSFTIDPKILDEINLTKEKVDAIRSAFTESLADVAALLN